MTHQPPLPEAATSPYPLHPAPLAERQPVPAPDANVRAFTTAPHSQVGGYAELTPTEFYKLILAADMGMNYYARENNPHSSTY